MRTNASEVELAKIVNGGDDLPATQPMWLSSARLLAELADKIGIEYAHIVPLHRGGLAFYWTAGEFNTTEVSVDIGNEDDDCADWKPFWLYVREAKRTVENRGFDTIEAVAEQLEKWHELTMGGRDRR